MLTTFSSQRDKAILTNYFNGVPRDENAEKTKVSGGTVSNTISRFKDSAKTGSLGGASRIYGVEKQIRELRELAELLRKVGSSISQVALGAGISGKLQSMGVKEDELEGFISDLYEHSEKIGYPVEKIVESAMELSKLEMKTGKSYGDLIKEYQETDKTKYDLELEIKDLEAEVYRSKQKVQEVLKKEKADLKALRRFVDLESGLQKYKINLEDLDRLNRILDNVKTSGYNISKILKFIGDVENLQALPGELQQEIRKLEREKNHAEGFLDKVKKDLAAEENTLSELNECKRLGLELDKLAQLRNLVIEIGAERNLTPLDALKKFFNDLKMQYDLKLGFEQEVEQLKKKVEDWAEKEKKLSNRYASLGTAVKSLEELNRLGIKPPQIEEWNRIITELKQDPSELTSKIRKYGNFKDLLEDAEEKANGAEKKLNTLKSQIKELENQKTKIEGSIDALTSESKKRIEQVSSQFDEELEKTKKKIKSAIGESMRDVETLSEKSIGVGEEIGRFEALKPLLSLISERKGEPHKVHSSVLQVNEAYSAWLKHSPRRTIFFNTSLESLIRSIKDEVGVA